MRENERDGKGGKETENRKADRRLKAYDVVASSNSNGGGSDGMDGGCVRESGSGSGRKGAGTRTWSGLGTRGIPSAKQGRLCKLGPLNDGCPNSGIQNC